MLRDVHPTLGRAARPHLHLVPVQVWWWDGCFAACAFSCSLRGLKLVPAKWVIPSRPLAGTLATPATSSRGKKRRGGGKPLGAEMPIKIVSYAALLPCTLLSRRESNIRQDNLIEFALSTPPLYLQHKTLASRKANSNLNTQGKYYARYA
jgi:hypothetical protein